MPDSGTSSRDHFVKQRRNLVIASLIIILHEANIASSLTALLLKDEQNIPAYSLSAIFLMTIIYLSLRYYQALDDEQGYQKTKKEFETRRDEYFLYNKLTYIRHTYQGQSRFNNAKYNDAPNPELIVDIDHDSGEKITILKVEEKKLVKLRRWHFLYQRIRISLLTIPPAFRFFIQRPALLEYVFPLVLAFFALLEICGLNAAAWTIEVLAFILKGIN